MNKQLAIIAGLFVTAMPASGQLKPLVAASTIPTTIKFEGHAGFALPTFCDEKGRSYVKLMQPGMGMAGPVFRILTRGSPRQSSTSQAPSKILLPCGRMVELLPLT
jgi:hypothetical protein